MNINNETKKNNIDLKVSYKRNNTILIDAPTKQELNEFFRIKYNEIIKFLISKPSDFKEEFKKIGVDYTKVSAFEIFCCLHKKLTIENTKHILGDLDLTKFELHFNSETNEYVLYDVENDITINKNTHEEIVKIVENMYMVEDFEEE